MKLGNEVDDRTLFFIYELIKRGMAGCEQLDKSKSWLRDHKELRALQDKAKRVAENPKLEKILSARI